MTMESTYRRAAVVIDSPAWNRGRRVNNTWFVTYIIQGENIDSSTVYDIGTTKQRYQQSSIVVVEKKPWPGLPSIVCWQIVNNENS